MVISSALSDSRVHGRWRLRKRLGEEGGVEFWAADGQPRGSRWLVLAFPAAHLVADSPARGAALLEATAGADPHLATARGWCPAGEGEPAILAYPSPGSFTVAALLSEEGGGPAVPDLLARLLLAETLAGIAAAHRLGLWHGLLGPASLWLAGAAPARLIADCPRDPRVVVVGCGATSLLVSSARATAVAAAASRPWAAPELRRGTTGPAADLWAAAAIMRALVAAPSSELEELLATLQAARPETRPESAEAAAAARELALCGLAAWRPIVPPPSRPLDLPAALPRERWLVPLAPHPRSRAAAATAPPKRAPAERWSLWRATQGPVLGALRPFTPRPLSPFAAAGREGAAMGLWLSLAPTAIAGILSALLALTLLLAVR